MNHDQDCPCATDNVPHGAGCADCSCVKNICPTCEGDVKGEIVDGKCRACQLGVIPDWMKPKDTEKRKDEEAELDKTHTGRALKAIAEDIMRRDIKKRGDEPSLGDKCAYCGHIYVSHFLSPTNGGPRTHCTVGDCRYCQIFVVQPKDKV